MESVRKRKVILTEETKNQIDKMSAGQIAACFRFFPSDMTTGETGKYMREKARKIAEDERNGQGTVQNFISPWYIRRR